jgi:lysophospholipase L1-like esterase
MVEVLRIPETVPIPTPTAAIPIPAVAALHPLLPAVVAAIPGVDLFLIAISRRAVRVVSTACLPIDLFRSRIMTVFARAMSFAIVLIAVSLADAQSPDPKAKPTDNPAIKPADRLAQAAWKKRHEGFLEKYKSGGVDVLFVGDSITQGWESHKKIWDDNFQSWKPGNIGISGDQTSHVLWRITEGKEIETIDPKVVVIMIGTNNVGNSGMTAEQTAEGVKVIVETFRTKKPSAKILLLGVFPRSGKGIAKDATAAKADELQPKILAINSIIAKLHDGQHIHFLDINKVFLDDHGNLPKKIMPDYLHLSAEGYQKWAAAIKEPVEKLLK